LLLVVEQPKTRKVARKFGTRLQIIFKLIQASSHDKKRRVFQRASEKPGMIILISPAPT
jgi:hypothetical protein